MIDHLSIGVGDLARARDFYDAVLGTLGYRRQRDIDIPGKGLVAHGYGAKDRPTQFWIGTPDRVDATANRQGGAHIAFAAESRKAVDAFYAAARKLGAADNGRPGLRPHYHADYYGAFVIDADGNKIEACCHRHE